MITSNIDMKDVDEPWPLEVIGHDGLAYNITMVPGDLVCIILWLLLKVWIVTHSETFFQFIVRFSTKATAYCTE